MTQAKKEMAAEETAEELKDCVVEETAKQETEEPVLQEAEEPKEKKGEKPKLKKDKMQEKLKALEAERDEYLNALQRERADFENYKKRNASLAADSFQNGVADASLAILPVLDNFERALETECADKAFVEGISMIKRQLQDTLKNMGVEEIPAEGQFDPALHNAVMQADVEGCASNDIVEVLQKGYALKDKVLRHTMVKVAK